MNKLSLHRRVQIIKCLLDGNSIRGTTRIVECSKNTVVKLLAEIGKACQVYQDKHLRDLKCQRIQLDEIWSFVGKKQRQVKEDDDNTQVGDIWTWTSICADTKLVPSWVIGQRDAEYANAFVSDLAARLSTRVQLTTDGHKPYLEAIEGAFGADVDYARLVKIYGAVPEEHKDRYSPAQCTGAKKKRVEGDPDPKHISTSYVERNNLTMRMAMRRFTRLTNAFSRKVENHCYAVALHFMDYNFARIHSSIRMSPAMAAGVTDMLWSVEDIVNMSDAYWLEKNPPKARGPYKKKISK